MPDLTFSVSPEPSLVDESIAPGEGSPFVQVAETDTMGSHDSAQFPLDSTAEQSSLVCDLLFS